MTRLFQGGGWTIDEETATFPDGRITKRARAKYSDTVHLIAFDAEEKLLILHEFRPFYGTHIWMLPSGHVDKELDPFVTAGRELREETGFAAEKISLLWKGSGSEKVKDVSHFYLAEKLTHNPLAQDADEMIEVHHLDIEDALDRVLTSPVVHMASAYGLMRFLRERKAP